MNYVLMINYLKKMLPGEKNCSRLNLIKSDVLQSVGQVIKKFILWFRYDKL